MYSAEPVALVATHLRREERLLLEAFTRRCVPCEHVDDRAIVYEVGNPRLRWRTVLNRAISATRRMEVSRLFSAAGATVINSCETVALCDSKIATSVALSRAGVPTPRTVVALSPGAGPEAAGTVGFPAVVKPATGSWGRGVGKVDDDETAEFVFSLRDQLASPVQKLCYLQELVPGRSLRVLVVGSEAVAAMTRESDHWVRNTASGARPRICQLDSGLAELAKRSADAVGGGVLGVDLIETESGRRVVLEVNAAPEFHGVAEANPDVPIADLILDHVLAQEC